ncbi:MAG: hypothetical protein HYW90_00490 [Candidatus Sungbacteria bacterium]|nr:hypothetical protein [Candidatus Sungbacteria bacterium]
MISSFLFWWGLGASAMTTILIILSAVSVATGRSNSVLGIGYEHEKDFWMIGMPALFFLGSIAAKLVGW